MIVSMILPIFFLYFVLLSGSCAEILSCGLQKVMNRYIMLRHILIFISIYIFTFVLNWYTFDSLSIQSLGEQEEKEEEKEEEKKITKQINIDMLSNWMKKSIIIYIIFFFVYIAFGLIMQIYLKAFSTKQYRLLYNKLFITKEDYTEENSKLIVTVHNITSIGFLLSISGLLFGSYKYYKRQRKEHKKNWNLIKFIFGRTHKGKECENL